MLDMKKYKSAFMPMRLQPVHKGHVALIKEVSKIADNINILIYTTKNFDFDNPFTGIERKKMLEYSINKENVENVKIVVMPYFEDVLKRFDFVFGNNLLKQGDLVVSADDFIVKEFGNRGFDVKISHDFVSEDVEHISGGKIREMIVNDDNKWIDYASSGFIMYEKEFNAKTRLKSLRK